MRAMPVFTDQKRSQSCIFTPDPGTTLFPTGTYYLYTTNLDHLSNDAENFGGLMTEVHIN